MAEETLLVLSTWPDLSAARSAARLFVVERLAACVNIVPSVESIYRWEGKVEEGNEVLALIKTNVTSYPALETRINELHGYEVPEVIAIRVDRGSAAYLAWIRDAVTA